MRFSLLAFAITASLATAAVAEATSPFGAPSAPLSAAEQAAIKNEAETLRKARAKAAAKAQAKRDAAIAAEAAAHPVVQSNPRPVSKPSDVMEMLQSAW